MSTDMTWQMLSTSSAETEALALAIGSRLRGGEVIELVSDLGGGKTTFTRGLARGAGSDTKVGSPTFTISKVYQAPKFEIHHFDFYRLGEAGIVGDELHELLGDPKVVVVVEWADVVQHVLPDERLRIALSRVAGDENARELRVTYPPKLAYLLEGTI